MKNVSKGCDVFITTANTVIRTNFVAFTRLQGASIKEIALSTKINLN